MTELESLTFVERLEATATWADVSVSPTEMRTLLTIASHVHTRMDGRARQASA